MEPIRINTIGMGVMSGRKYLGHGWTLRSKSRTPMLVHTTMLCRSPQDMNDMRRVAFFSEDGVTLVEEDGRRAKITLCEKCPPYVDTAWRDQANCKGEDMSLQGIGEVKRAALIERTCGGCAVVQQCYDFGHSSPDNMGLVWGGVFFTRSHKKKGETP